MKQTVRQRLILGLLLFAAMFSVVPSRVFAVAGTVYFDQSSGTIINGTEFTVEVRGNVPGPNTWPFYGGGTTTIVTYDPSKLQMISYNDTGGVFRSGTKNWNGTASGTVRYQSSIAINAPGVNNQKIISIKFKALSPGSATLGFRSGTSVNDGPTTGTPATFTIAQESCPAGKVGTPPNCTTPPPSPSPSPRPSSSPTPTPNPAPAASFRPTPTTTQPAATPAPVVAEEVPAPTNESDGGLKIENVKITTNRQLNTVSWTLNKNDVPPKLSYGTSKNSLTQEATVTTLESGVFEAHIPDLKLGALYHFSIKAATPDQLQGATYSGTFTTRGYPVQLTIQQNGVLSPGAKIKIGERSFVANKEAIITTELGEGKYDASITTSGSSTSSPVSFNVVIKTIPSSGEPELQQLTLNAVVEGVSVPQSTFPPVLVIGGIIAFLVGASMIGGFLLFRRRQQQSQDQVSVDSDLLAASYGPSMNDYRINTPEPNLETQGGTLPLPPPQANQPNDQPPVDSQPPAGDIVGDAPMPPNIALDENAALPLPPEQFGAQNPPIEKEEPLAAGPEPAQQADELSQPVIAVESVEAPDTPEVQPLPTNAQEETAVYDAETGELDIIHHHQSLEQQR